ncbi:MAG: hypothetical protein M3362_01740 [Acidobacteriota bacterium]|nr:hypothetical protein [Acidobacteriota bacterium]
MADSIPTAKLMLMGLPESGKSTFIAALWELVRSNDVSDALEIGTLHGDYSYINKLHKLWSEGKPLTRTKVGQEGIVSIPLKDRSRNARGQDEIEIVLPDLSGESFDAQWEKRVMSKAYLNHLKEATGLLVFVHSQKFNPGDLIDTKVEGLDAILSAILPKDPTTTNESSLPALNSSDKTETMSEETPPKKAIPFDPEKVPTQTKVVDIIYQSLKLTDNNQIKKVAFIISAWDLVNDEFDSPADWLTKQMPLVAQFLNSNSGRFNRKIYGISAQGDELPTNQESENNISLNQRKKKLLSKISPFERILVTDGKVEHHNITAPIQWLLQK